jgi:ELWxxDGT repeat protein
LQFCAIAGAVVFDATSTDGTGGVWISDGSSAQRVADAGGFAPTGASIAPCATVREFAFLRAQNLSGEPTVWAVDRNGTAERILVEVNGYNSLFDPGGSADVGGRTIFRLTSISGLESSIWVTDGTEAGTHLLLDPVPGSGTIFLQIVSADGRAYFYPPGTARPIPLWSSDGTAAGTRLIRSQVGLSGEEIILGTSLGEDFLVVLRNTAGGPDRLRLIAPDGAALELGPLPDGGTSPDSRVAHRCDGVTYFAEPMATGNRLWATNGTPEGTVEVASEIENPLASYCLGAELIFRNETLDSGSEPWRSDGTTSGTRRIADVCAGECSSSAFITTAPLGALISGINALNQYESWYLGTGAPAAAKLSGLCQSSCVYHPFLVGELSNRLLFAADSGEATLDLWSLHPTQGTTERITHFAPPSAWVDGTGATVGDSFLFRGPSAVGVEPLAIRRDRSACGVASDLLCLHGDRFRASARWRDFSSRASLGHAVPLSEASGYFWFFSDGIAELILKIVDGADVNGHTWVYFGSLSNVETSVTIEDLWTGVVRTYDNPLGSFSSFGDIEALPTGLTAGEHSSSEPIMTASRLTLEPSGTPTCFPSATRVCLLGGRFALEGQWMDFEGASGVAYAESLTPDTGYLWFFDPDIVEIVAKLVDGSGYNNYFWVYYGSLSNIEFTLYVTDTVTGETRPYFNPLGSFGSFGDIEAFPAD